MSVLRNALGFLEEFGFFDVILPFLLVFAVAFGILEKSMILGYDEIRDKKYPKTNINAVVAFVIAMLLVAATKIVDALAVALPRIALLLVVSLSFLMMIGIFISPGGVYDKISNKMMAAIMGIMCAIVVFIFLSAIPANENESLLEYGFYYLANYWSGSVVGSVVLFLVVIFAIFYIVGSKKGENKKEGE